MGLRGMAAVPGPDGTPGTTFQSAMLTTATDGTLTWTYPVAYGVGVVPIVWGIAQGPDPTAGAVFSLQLQGAPTNTSAKFQLSRSNAAVVALIGLTVLSIPASPGATVVTVFAKAP